MSKEFPTIEEKWDEDSDLIKIGDNRKSNEEFDWDSIPDEEGDEDES